MKTFLEYLTEAKRITDKDSIWMRGDSTENRIEKFKRLGLKVGLDDPRTPCSIYSPLYLTNSIDYAKHYCDAHNNDHNLITCIRLKLTKENVLSKILDLTDPSDLLKIGWSKELAKMFSLADVYYSYCTASAFMNKREHQPKEFVAARFQVYKQNNLDRPGYGRSVNKKFIDILSMKNLTINTITMSDLTDMEFIDKYIDGSEYFNGVKLSSLDLLSINAYLEAFKKFNSAATFYNTEYKLHKNTMTKYIDILTLQLLLDIKNAGYVGYYCPENNYNLPTTHAKYKCPCIALFDNSEIEEIFDIKADMFSLILSSITISKLDIFAKLSKDYSVKLFKYIRQINKFIFAYAKDKNVELSKATLMITNWLSNGTSTKDNKYYITLEGSNRSYIFIYAKDKREAIEKLNNTTFDDEPIRYERIKSIQEIPCKFPELLQQLES